ncbi:MAG: SCO family protein [Phycisphaerales bacterium JB043]
MSTLRVPSHARLACCLLAALLVFVCAMGASAQYSLKELPEERQGVDVFERRGDVVPSDIVFTDSRGETVTLGDYFDGERPVILIMGYYTCPLLCDIVFHKAQQGFNDLAWTMGKEYRVVTVSIDPEDTPEAARERQESLLGGYKREVSPESWEFLVGDQASIDALAGSIGFSYKALPEVEEFSHPAALTFLSPDGEISNYLIGLVYPEKQLRLALTEAAEGKVGSLFDKVLLFCHVYDLEAGAFVWEAMTIMRIGATAVAIALGSFVFLLFRRERRARQRRLGLLSDKTIPHGATAA